MTDRQMKQWIEGQLGTTLNEMSRADAELWHRLAEEDTWRFLRYGEYALRLRRSSLHQLPPLSRKEVMAFLLEFRVKIQLIHDRFGGLPNVAMFDFGGAALVNSWAFQQMSLLHGESGGVA